MTDVLWVNLAFLPFWLFFDYIMVVQMQSKGLKTCIRIEYAFEIKWQSKSGTFSPNYHNFVNL